jgi:uncharacterized membrane protein YfcA
LTVLNDIIALSKNIDQSLFMMILTGFLAQMINGSMGMGFGLVSTSVLLGLGIPLPAISSSVHTAEFLACGASAYSHYKLKNVNKKLLKNMLIPAVAGSVLGALLLSILGKEYSEYVKPLIACYTLFLGIRLLSKAKVKEKQKKPVKRVGWLAAIGATVDAFGGCGWGPLVTSTLIAKGRSPRYVVGTVNITRFFLTFGSTVTFFVMIGVSHWKAVVGLIIGGIIAAPIAARLVGKIPARPMLIAVGLLVVVWSGYLLAVTLVL